MVSRSIAVNVTALAGCVVACGLGPPGRTQLSRLVVERAGLAAPLKSFAVAVQEPVAALDWRSDAWVRTEEVPPAAAGPPVSI